MTERQRRRSKSEVVATYSGKGRVPFEKEVLRTELSSSKDMYRLNDTKDVRSKQLGMRVVREIVARDADIIQSENLSDHPEDLTMLVSAIYDADFLAQDATSRIVALTHDPKERVIYEKTLEFLNSGEKTRQGADILFGTVRGIGGNALHALRNANISHNPN